MTDLFWLAIGLGLLGFFGYRAGRVWWDAGRWTARHGQRLRWAVLGAVAPARYWWEPRIEAMSAQEQERLLVRETTALGLSRADGLRCPLCGAEVPHAWALTGSGQPTVAPGPVKCPACDFRLDACRHCSHFLPGAPQGWQGSGWASVDLGSGRCSHYQATQPVEQISSPDMARRLRARGYDQLRGPLPIADSYLPPDFCRAFRPEHTRLQQGGLRWPDARRRALLRLLSAPAAPRAESSAEITENDAKWLL